MNALATSTSHLGHARAGAQTRIGVFSPRWEHRTEGKPSSSGRSTWRSCSPSAEIAADHINYLQPEPMLQSPDFAVEMALDGMSIPAYAYALNNPIAFVDEDGLYAGSAAKYLTKHFPALKPIIPPVFPWESSELGDGTPQMSFDRGPDPLTCGGGPQRGPGERRKEHENPNPNKKKEARSPDRKGDQKATRAASSTNSSSFGAKAMITSDLRYLKSLERRNWNARQLANSSRAASRVAAIVERSKTQAAKGDVKAMLSLAWMYRVFDLGTPQAIARLYLRAAQQGDAIGLVETGFRRIRRGKRKEGRAMLKRAAALGNVHAKVLLADSWLSEGKVRLRPLAEELLRDAARQGSARAAFLLGWKRDFVDNGRWREATRWYRKGAFGGDVPAMVNYAVCLERGLGVRQEKSRALLWFRRAAKKGNRNALRGVQRLSRS